MKKLIIKKVDNYDYTLEDENNNTCVLNMEFISKYKPSSNDIIYMDEKLLKEVNLFTFTESDEKNVDVKIVTINSTYYFKRIYG